MTRFARAKGSKACNEKAPEDSTPWEVMKEQLLHAKKENDDAKNRQHAENQRIENYENFLKERKVQKKKATWCDFPEIEKDSNKLSNAESGSGEPAKKKNKKNRKKKNVDDDMNSNNKSLSNETNNTVNTDNKSKKKKNKNKTLASEQAQINPTNTSTEVSETQVKKKNKNENKLKTNLNPEKIDSPTADGNFNKESKDTSFCSNQNTETANQNKNLKKMKKKKLIDGKPVRRKAINDKSFQLIINGKEIELVRFGGFPIMKKDAERLTELQDSMVKKGIPKSEVQRTMKLERRRAEKALARLKREVCYNCRKGGHNLSDCPELKSKIPGVDAAEGVCFKCGSTEHRQFECKVQRDKEFRFATCFICKEPGHIARQCPDNPKGLYPNGGSCKLCGDVTHLRKDCHTAKDKKEESAVKLQTLDSAENIEDIGQAKTVASSEGSSKKPKKIKF